MQPRSGELCIWNGAGYQRLAKINVGHPVLPGTGDRGEPVKLGSYEYVIEFFIELKLIRSA